MEETSTQGQTQGSSSFFKTLLMILLPLVLGAGIVYAVAKQKPEFLGLPKGAAQVQAEVDMLVG